MQTTLKTKSACSNLLLIFTFLFFFSCQKDISLENGGAVPNPPDLSTKISSSVSGFVTDENNAAVMGATVQFGSSSITTDKYGYFEAKNVQVVKEAAVVTVIKPGYFKGIKTYMAREGKAAFFRIKLIPKTNVGNVNAASGGTISLANGLSIKLPAGGFVNAATNIVYTGTVNVAAYWINPTAADLTNIMPGDLRGINTEGALKLLQTFGMAAVELTGASGELLQIKNGQKASLSLPIPSSLSASAPATIPLWYFDEAKGLWKEEGSAVKTGNSYTGDVSHFSYWNCDYPFPNAVNFDCTVVDAANNPVQWALVDIYYSSGQYTGCHGYTDANGFVSGAIPANSQLIIKIFTATSVCAVYTQAFTTVNSNISFGSLAIGNTSTATITGNLTNCSNQAVTNGYVLLYLNNQYYRYDANANGNFNFSAPICGSTNIANFIGGDITTSQEGSLNNYALASGINNVGNITACGINNQEFINYTVNGAPFSINVPIGTVVQTFDSLFHGISISGSQLPASQAFFNFSSLNIGVGSVQNVNNFGSYQTNGQTTIPAPVSVTITEYGNIGQFISGSFSGTFNDATTPATIYNVTCNFRIRRSL